MLDVNEIGLSRTAESYAIINISVANLRSQAVFQSELLNQVLLGTIVPVYERQNDFCFVENWDGFRGWLSEASLVIVDKHEAEAWHKAATRTFRRNFGLIRSTPDERVGVMDLVAGAILKRGEVHSSLTKVELPDKRTGFVETEHLLDTQARGADPGPEAVARIARSFLGIPYLWGGTSSKAFDCSGFVQTVFRFLNIPLPRDAGDMVALADEIDPSDLKTGDLLFFGKTPVRITHVALSLGGSIFIHADGFVRLNSFDQSHPLYNAHRHETFLIAKRLPSLASPNP
ncbi:MAG: C40 family peptidase [bacterium]